MAASNTQAERQETHRRCSLVIALGGNALDFDAAFDSPDLQQAAETLARRNPAGLVLTHGNGPQIGELAMQEKGPRQLYLLGAESEGMIGYLIEQAIGNARKPPIDCATLLTRIEVAADDPAFSSPGKPVGPWLDEQEKHQLTEHGWQFIENDGRYRRVVPSPSPRRILQSDAVKLLLANGYWVICSGGGGIPVVKGEDGRLQGVDAVIDKDDASAMLAMTLEADMLVLATDVDAVYRNWGERGQSPIARAQPSELEQMDLPEGSMAPKVKAACRFVRTTGNPAIIGALGKLDSLLDGRSGTRIERETTSLNGDKHG